jgi:hypothetical protein
MQVNLDDVKNYCIDQLGLFEYDIDIIITECCLKHDRAMGWCYDVHDGEIDIEIEETLSPDKKIITLCHEMVHARQACRGDESFCEDEANGLEQELYDGYIHTTNR